MIWKHFLFVFSYIVQYLQKKKKKKKKKGSNTDQKFPEDNWYDRKHLWAEPWAISLSIEP